jgi:hypothetical protein
VEYGKKNEMLVSKFVYNVQVQTKDISKNIFQRSKNSDHTEMLSAGGRALCLPRLAIHVRQFRLEGLVEELEVQSIRCSRAVGAGWRPDR